MSNMVIFKPLPISAVATGGGSGASNLLTPDPKEVWTSETFDANHNIDIDLGSTQSIDSFLVGYTTYDGPGAAGPATLSITGGTSYTATTISAAAAFLAASSSSSPVRKHSFRKIAAPVNARYVRLNIVQSDNDASTVGIVAIGLAFQPTYNREWGGGRQVIDTGTKEGLLGGGFGIGEGARKAAYRWTLGDLTDAEVEALYALTLDRGETRPAVVIEDPDATSGLNERIHYGLFDRFEAYERMNPSQTRWSLSLTEWV